MTIPAIFKVLKLKKKRDRYGYEKQFKIYRTIEYFEDPKREALATMKRAKEKWCQSPQAGNWHHLLI